MAIIAHTTSRQIKIFFLGGGGGGGGGGGVGGSYPPV